MTASPNRREIVSSHARAIVGVAIALVALLLASFFLLSSPPKAACSAADCREVREWIASVLAVAVLITGLFQFRQSQLWKRAEFVASEMKTFFADPNVRKAMTMIDWSKRNINLFEDKSNDPNQWPLVDRNMQIMALVPHTIKGGERGSASDDSIKTSDSDLARYTIEEAAIRDIYDTFLDGLERFASFLETRLVTVQNLRPYLAYWVDDVARVEVNANEADDNYWAAMFFVYVHFYNFTGVQSLFKEFGYDIGLESDLFRTFFAVIKHSDLKNRLAAELKRSNGNARAAGSK